MSYQLLLALFEGAVHNRSNPYANLERSLRLPGETDNAFAARARRIAEIARTLVDACLANECMQHQIADDDLPTITEQSVRRSPVVRVEFEQAIAFGDIGSALAATKHKHWGYGPQILPLETGDWFYAKFVTYQYRESSVYNRRFEQRRRLKELLGRKWRPLVERAKRQTKTEFLNGLQASESAAIFRRLDIDAAQFWRASKGKAWLDLPPRIIQQEFDW